MAGWSWHGGQGLPLGRLLSTLTIAAAGKDLQVQLHQPNPALNLELNLEKSAADSQPGRGWIASAGSLLKGPWSFRPTIIWNSGCPAAPLCFLCLRCLPVLFLFSFFVAPALKCTTVLQGCWTRKLSLLTCQMSSAMVGKAGVACDCLVFPAFPIDLKK